MFGGGSEMAIKPFVYRGFVDFSPHRDPPDFGRFPAGTVVRFARCIFAGNLPHRSRETRVHRRYEFTIKGHECPFGQGRV